MIDYFETKSQPITRFMVIQAYRKVRANKGSGGVDGMTWEEFELHKAENIYKLWNRLSSGCYYPMPVKEVEIEKKGGGVRKLGVPTLMDRIAQQVVRAYIEPTLDPLFNPAYTHNFWFSINQKLLKWVNWEKDLGLNASIRWLKLAWKRNPLLFPHWELVHP